jgi:penicillin amidase
MDALRLVGRGESARWLGPAQLASDIEVRRDRYSRERIDRQWEAASETTQAALEGFADGVNRKLVELVAEGELPGKFAALGRPVEPWKPEDSIAWINYALGFFGVSGGAELSNARTLAAMFENVDDESEAWDAYGDLNNVVVPDDHYGSVRADEVAGTDERALEYDELSEAQLDAIRAADGAVAWGVEEWLPLPDGLTEGLREARGMLEGFRFGSNAIIVGSEHSAVGRPLLGAGPQMGLFKPPIPYEIGLHGAGFDVVGTGVVAAPALVIGRTPDVAWTVTTSQDEMIDTIAVELDPEDRHRYRWDGEYHEMATEEVTHYTNPVGGVTQGATDPTDYAVVRQEVARIEQEGTSMPVIAWNPSENVAYCQRITTRMEELDGAFQWAEVGRSNGIAEFESTLSEFPLGFNFHVVSGEEIAYVRTGKLPDRRGSADPRMPVPQSGHDWGGFEAGTAVASVRNPERGYVVNWNNAPAPGWRAGSPQQQWGSVHRVDVMDRLLREALTRTGGALTREDVEDIVADCIVEHPFAPPVGPGHAGGGRAGVRRRPARGHGPGAGRLEADGLLVPTGDRRHLRNRRHGDLGSDPQGTPGARLRGRTRRPNADAQLRSDERRRTGRRPPRRRPRRDRQQGRDPRGRPRRRDGVRLVRRARRRSRRPASPAERRHPQRDAASGRHPRGAVRQPGPRRLAAREPAERVLAARRREPRPGADDEPVQLPTVRRGRRRSGKRGDAAAE